MSEAAVPLPALPWRVPVVLLPALLFIVLAIHLVLTTPFPAPDELEHVSYAAYLQETDRLLPRFEAQRTLRRDDVSTWDARGNYIGHPSPYYLLIGRFFDRTLPAQQAILAPRLVSLVLLSMGLLAALAAGSRVFQRDPTALLVFGTMLMLCPEVLSVARQVNNDALGILGGGLAYAGVLAPGRRRWLSPALMGIGLLLALWAKPNAGLEVGLFLGLVLVLQRGAPRHVLAAIGAGAVLGVLPTALIVAGYGAIVPVTAEGVFPVHSLGSFAEYWPAFLLNLGYTWGFLQTGTWPIDRGVGALGIPALAALLGVLAAATWSARRRLADRRVAVLAAGLVALMLVVPIHLWFGATRLGYSVPAASFRYYLPLWPALAHGLAWAVQDAATPTRRIAVAAVCAAALVLGWLPAS